MRRMKTNRIEIDTRKKIETGQSKNQRIVPKKQFLSKTQTYLHIESVLDRTGGLPNEGFRSGDLFGERGGDGTSGVL